MSDFVLSEQMSYYISSVRCCWMFRHLFKADLVLNDSYSKNTDWLLLISVRTDAFFIELTSSLVFLEHSHLHRHLLSCERDKTRAFRSVAAPFFPPPPGDKWKQQDAAGADGQSGVWTNEAAHYHTGFINMKGSCNKSLNRQSFHFLSGSVGRGWDGRWWEFQIVWGNQMKSYSD